MPNTTSKKQQTSKQDKQILKDSERLFRAVWKYASDAMALSSSDGTVFAANPAYFHLYGFPLEEVIGKHFSIIFPEEQRKTAHELYDYIFQSPAISPSFAVPVRRADGTERFVDSRYRFISHKGQRIAMLSIVRDITEQKRAEEALWVSEEKLRIALEAGKLGSWEWDIESNLIRWSAHLDARSDYAGGELGVSYENFMELIHPQERTLVDQTLRSALEEGTDFTVDFRAGLAGAPLSRKRIQGEILHNEEGKPIRVIGISMDVPQRE